MHYYTCLFALLTILNSSIAAKCPGSAYTIKAPCYYSERDADCGIVCNGSTPMDVTAIFSDLNRKLPVDRQPFSYLTLQNTAIDELPANAFAGIQFKTISIDGASSLVRVNGGAFIGTDKTVTQIVIADTPVNEIMTPGNHAKNLFGAIRSLQGLVSCDISGTEIQSLPSYGFGGLANLRLITLTSNPIQTIHTAALGGLATLQRLTITSSPVGHVAVRAFRTDGSGANQLSIILNDLKSLTAADALATGAFDSIGRPTELWLNGDGFEHLDRRVFDTFLADNKDNFVRDSEFRCEDTRNTWISDRYPIVWSRLLCK